MGAVGDIFARGEVAEHFEIIQVYAADDSDGQLVKLAGQLQGLAQLFLGVTIGQCGNVVEGAQGLLLALGFALSLLALSVALQGRNQLAEGGQQWLKQFLQVRVVAVRAVGDAEHADHLTMVLQGQAQEAVEGRMPMRQAAAPWVLLGCVAQQRLATAQDLAEQAIEVAKFHAGRCLASIEAQCLLAPGNVADGVGF